MTILELFKRIESGKDIPKNIIFDKTSFYYDDDDKEFYMTDDEKEICQSLLTYIFENGMTLLDKYETDYQILMAKVKVAKEEK